MGRKIFRRTSASFVVGLLVPFHPRRGGLGASISGAAGIRCCDRRCPKSEGIIRVASGDGEQEMIAEFSRRFRTPPRTSGQPADT